MLSPIQTPDDEKYLGLDNASGYVVDFSGKDKTVTKLHKAAWFGNLDKLKSALKKIEIDATDRHQRTALNFAVVQGHPNIVWYLLGNNANTSICDDEGCTPLLKAIECGHKECLKLLLDRGADVNATDYTGNTGLHIAAKQGSLDIVSALLNKNARTDISNNTGDYPLHFAIKSDNKELVDLLLKFKAEVNVLDRENRTPLMLAAKNGNLPLTKLLLETGAQLSLVDSNGWTAEDYALLGGHNDIALILKPMLKDKSEIPKGEKITNDKTDLINQKQMSESWDDSKSDNSDTNESVSKKLKEFFKSCSIDKSETEEKEKSEKSETTPDSPNVEVIPPFCQPPRSWDMIQAGMIDGNKTGVEPKRLSLTTLGTLHSRRESFTEGSSVTSPKYTLSLNRRKDAKIDKSFAKQRFSFHEEITLKNFFNQNTSKEIDLMKSSSLKKLEIEKDKSINSLVNDESKNKNDELCDTTDSKVISINKSAHELKVTTPSENVNSFENDGGMEKEEKNEEKEENLSPVFKQVEKEEKYNSWDSQSSEQGKETNFPSPPSALELGADMAKSLKFMKGMSIDRPSVKPSDKNIWKNAYETRSIDFLEENTTIPEISINNFTKRHVRQHSTSQNWISKDILPCQKPVDRLIDVNRRISEQLECYDQALKELAETSSAKKALKLTAEKISASQNYYSLPSSKGKTYNEDKRTVPERKEFNNSGPSSAPTLMENYIKAKKKDDGDENVTKEPETVKSPKDKTSPKTDSDKVQKPSPPTHVNSFDGTERKTKRRILLAMREVKPSPNIAATFKASIDDQILSPLTKPDDDSFDGDYKNNSKASSESEKESPMNGNYFFGLGRQETVKEKPDVGRRKSSSSETGEEPTLWLQDDSNKIDVLSHESDNDVSEIAEDERGVNNNNNNRTCSFSPLEIIYQEILKENEKSEKVLKTEIQKNTDDDGDDGGGGGGDGGGDGGDEEESKRESSILRDSIFGKFSG